MTRSKDADLAALDTELVGRIQALPQELQDVILDYALSLDDDEDIAVAIDDDYRFPWQIQINSRTRKKVTQAYYTRSTFLLPPLVLVARPSVDEHRDWLHLLGIWLRAVPRERRKLINSIRIPLSGFRARPEDIRELSKAFISFFSPDTDIRSVRGTSRGGTYLRYVLRGEIWLRGVAIPGRGNLIPR